VNAIPTSTIDKAVDAGIPVVTWDSDAPKSSGWPFYGVTTTDRQSWARGRKALNGKARASSPAWREQLADAPEGAKDALAKSRITIVETTTSRKQPALRESSDRHEPLSHLGRGFRSMAGRCSARTRSRGRPKREIHSFDTVDAPALRDGKVRCCSPEILRLGRQSIPPC